jgi:hypothetical protein
MSAKGQPIMTITGQRIVLALLLVAGIIGVYFVPMVWQHPVGNVLAAVVFGALLIDWVWLRFVKPGTGRGDGGGGH